MGNRGILRSTGNLARGSHPILSISATVFPRKKLQGVLFEFLIKNILKIITELLSGKNGSTDP
jgi:hypothetical protein